MFIYLFIKDMLYADVCVKQNLGFVYSKFQDGDCKPPGFWVFQGEGGG